MYEARQNKPQVPRTFSSLCKKEYEHQFQTKNNEKQNSCVKVIQYGKRKNAIEHTINNRIVRGNIVIDVVKTKGFNIYLLSNFRKDQNNILNYLIQNQIISDNSLDKYLAISYLIAFLQIGNCGEFADFVMTSLAVKTDDKKRSKYAFRCSLVEKTQNGNNMDHAFNMTYNTNMKPQTNLSVQGEDVDKLKKEAIVLDAWDNYSIMTLDRFLNNGNPYRKKIGIENIFILYSVQMNSVNKFSSDKSNKIYEYASFYKKSMKLKYLGMSDSERQAFIHNRNNIFNINIEENLHDYR